MGACVIACRLYVTYASVTGRARVVTSSNVRGAMQFEPLSRRASLWYQVPDNVREACIERAVRHLNAYVLVRQVCLLLRLA